MPGWLQAGGWGLLGGSALLVKAAVGYLTRIPQKVVASIMAFGAGVLLSAVSFELIAEAHERAGLMPTALGAVAGALVYTACNVLLARRGARHRKRSGDQQPSEAEHGGSGTALALGALLDGVPESIVIGTSLLGGGAVSAVNRRGGVHQQRAVGAVQRRRHAAGWPLRRPRPRPVGRHRGDQRYRRRRRAHAARRRGARRAGVHHRPRRRAILTMIADTAIPEAFAHTHLAIGLITLLGFLCAFALSTIDN